MKFKATIEGHESRILLKGRTAWTLQQLMTAGLQGVGTRPRWSGDVKTMRDNGVIIDTVMEKHVGDYAEIHGRYVLRSAVAVQAV